MTQFKTLYEEQRERLFYYLLRMTGDYDLSRDIMQESFVRCLGRYGDRITNIALLYKVARNLVFDHKRKSDRNAPLEQQQTADPTDIEHQILVHEHYKKVLAALIEYMPSSIRGNPILPSFLCNDRVNWQLCENNI